MQSHNYDTSQNWKKHNYDIKSQNCEKKQVKIDIKKHNYGINVKILTKKTKLWDTKS